MMEMQKSTRLHGHWLALARLAWLIFAFLVIGVLSAAIGFVLLRASWKAAQAASSKPTPS